MEFTATNIRMEHECVMTKHMVHLDPRTKLFIVFITGVFAFIVEDAGLFILVSLVAIYLLIQGMVAESFRYLISFAILYAIQFLVYKYNNGLLIMFGFMTFFIARFIPVIMACASLSASSPGELIAALQRMHFPKYVVIPLAVGLRFMPCISREYLAIKDAARLRGISVTSANIIKKPTMTIECAYVPLLMRSLKISDELAASAAARGIDFPGVRTSLRDITIRWTDILVAAIFVAFGIFIILFTL